MQERCVLGARPSWPHDEGDAGRMPALPGDTVLRKDIFWERGHPGRMMRMMQAGCLRSRDVPFSRKTFPGSAAILAA
jgi:hypothetical protein